MVNYNCTLQSSPSGSLIEAWDGTYLSTPNAVPIGGSIPSSGIVDDFVANSRYLLPSRILPLGSTPWKLKIRITTGSNISGNQYIFGKEYWFDFYISNGRFQTDVGNDSSWQQTLVRGSTPVAANTTYDVTYEYTGTAHNVYLTVNGATNLELSVNNSTAHADIAPYIGWMAPSSLPAFTGSIDLNHCSFESNGEVVWTGMFQTKNYTSNLDTLTLSIPEGTEIDYKVSKEGYQTIEDSVLVDTDITQTVVLKRLNPTIIKRFLNNTQINKLYLGDTLIYGKPKLSNWTISDNGTTVTRNAYPYTLPAWDNSSTTITANSNLSFTNFKLFNYDDPVDVVVNIDGDTSRSLSNNYRDCVVIAATDYQSTPAIFLSGGESQPSVVGSTEGNFFKLDKDGSVKEIVDEWQPYTPTIPNNAFTYDSVNDQIIIAAGTYDASIRENTPCVIETPIVLSNQGGTYADQDFKYRLSFSTSRYNWLPGSAGASASLDTMRGKVSTTSYTKAMHASSTSTSGVQLTTSYADCSSRRYMSGSISRMQSFTFGAAGATTEFEMDINQWFRDNLSPAMTYNIRFDNIKKSSTRLTSSQIVLIFTDNTTETSPVNTSTSQYLYPVTYEKLSRLKTIRIIFTSTGTTYTNNYYSMTAILQLQGTASSNYSRPLKLETRQDWKDPTQGMLELGYGYFTGLYANIGSSGQLESITSTPTYEVLD